MCFFSDFNDSFGYIPPIQMACKKDTYHHLNLILKHSGVYLIV